jgi:hypothetical protein
MKEARAATRRARTGSQFKTSLPIFMHRSGQFALTCTYRRHMMTTPKTVLALTSYKNFSPVHCPDGLRPRTPVFGGFLEKFSR